MLLHHSTCNYIALLDRCRHIKEAVKSRWTITWLTWLILCRTYRKNPKKSDTPKIYCHNPNIWLLWIFHREMRPNDADGIANSVDPGQTALIWVYTVCSDLSVRKFRNIKVIIISELPFSKTQIPQYAHSKQGSKSCFTGHVSLKESLKVFALGNV